MRRVRSCSLKGRIGSQRRLVTIAAIAGAFAACESAVREPIQSLETPAIAAALEAIQPAAIEDHMRVLSDDRLEGRGPGTRGFAAASRYVEARFEEIGLEPAGVDGSFRQPVALQASFVEESRSTFAITYKGGISRFGYGEDYTLAPNPVTLDARVSAPIVFVGFGVSAPSLGYDDYADIDVEGKVVAHLNGAPGALPNDERAYYASPAIKSEEAAKRGAVAMISFTAPNDARFRWSVGVARARRGSHAWLDDEGIPRGRGGASSIQGSVSLNHNAAQALFQGSPVSIERVFESAANSEPQAFELAVGGIIRTASTHRQLESHNLVARLEGSDADLKDEHVVYVAHLDHLGIGDPVRGDSIYNGAHDNASGTAILLEIARAYGGLPKAPRRSILFLAVTAEEWGLLGSDYFVHNPTIPREFLVANLALDMPFLFYPLLDIVPFGAEHSSLSDAVAVASKRMDIGISPDPWPEEVVFVRSDHFSFVRQGIPALFMKSGFATGDERDGEKIHDDFRRERYHTPFDEMDQDFDFGAGASHARFNFLTGYYVAMQDQRPVWNEDDFFGGLFAPDR